MTRTKKRRCTCGRPAHPDARTARIAAARGTRQSENAQIQCAAFECPSAGHHTMLFPANEQPAVCTCGQVRYPTLHGADIMLAHLQQKHPDETNPYVMYRCTQGGTHIARDRAVPAGGRRALQPTQPTPGPEAN